MILTLISLPTLLFKSIDEKIYSIEISLFYNKMKEPT